MQIIARSAYNLFNGRMKFLYSKILFFIPLPILILLQTRGIPVNNTILILTTIASIISSFLIFQIVFLATNNKLYASLSLLIFISLGILHINFTSPIIFALMFGLLTCFFLLYFNQTSKQRYLFLAGLSAFIAVVLYKYLFFLIIFSSIVFFAFLPRNKSLSFLTFLYGYIWGFILFSVYLLISNSFPLFVESFILYSGFDLSFETANYQTLMLFLIPFVLIFISSFILLKRQRFHLLFLPCFVGIFSISMIPNFANLNYIGLSASLSGILLSILMRYSANSTVKSACIIFSVLLVFIGVIMRYGYN